MGKQTNQIMKKLFILLLYTIFSCSSDTPVNMDKVLFDSGGRFKSLESKKVYSGPGFKEYRNGKKLKEINSLGKKNVKK